MNISRLGVGVAIAGGLTILMLQNNAPRLALRFLGNQTLPLPLGVWLSGAIAAGMLTTLVIFGLTQGRASPPPNARRQWTVHPDATPPPYGNAVPAGRSSPPSDREPSAPTGAPSQTVPAASARPAPNPQQAVEDWQAWGDRVSPRQWEDWTQAESPDPLDATLSKRQQRDRQKAETTLQDLDKGWDDSAQKVVYVAPGGSAVEDALDEIEDGWEDWEEEDVPLADTAYAQRYEGREQSTRRDVIYAPPDEGAAGASEESVYDADYRVIVPPYRPLEDDEAVGDRG